MARTAFTAPAHRIMRRLRGGASPFSQPATAGPSADLCALGIQDARLRYNTAASAAGGPEVIMWADPGSYPVLTGQPGPVGADVIAPAQVPVANKPMTLATVPWSSSPSNTGVNSSLVTLYPAIYTVPAGGAVFIERVPTYNSFGHGRSKVWLYEPSTMISRPITVTSAGNDSGATMQILGIDIYGYLVHYNIPMANAGVASPFLGKCLKAVISATPVGTLSGANVSIGTADAFGFPFWGSGDAVGLYSQVEGWWATAAMFGGSPGATWNPGAALGPNNPQAANSSDVRGSFGVPAGSPSNSTSYLEMHMRPNIQGMAKNGINIGMFGNPQF